MADSGKMKRRIRGRPALHRARIEKRAQEMRESGERINKSRIARELCIPIRTVFRTLPALAR